MRQVPHATLLLIEMIKSEMFWNKNFQILVCSGNELRFLEVVENCKNLNLKKRKLYFILLRLYPSIKEEKDTEGPREIRLLR